MTALVKSFRKFFPCELPEEYEPFRGRMRRCHTNSMVLCFMRMELTYCEGLAFPFAGSPPIEHAWAVDAFGCVIDPTWPAHGVAYYGVTFTYPEVCAMILDPSRRANLSDWEADHGPFTVPAGTPSSPWLASRQPWA